MAGGTACPTTIKPLQQGGTGGFACRITFPCGGDARYYPLTCKICKTPMKELKGHIYHKKRKWKCPKCGRVRMQEQK